MNRFPKNPISMFTVLIEHWSLFLALLKRDVTGKYKGAVLGVVWSLITPLLMLAVYTFVFSVVFQSRWKDGSDSRVEFSMLLFCGLIVFNVFSESLNRASNLISENVNYVKKVVFPLDILPWVIVGSALFHAISSIVILILSFWVFVGTPSYTIIFLPLILIPLILFVVGISWFLASIGAFFKDVGQVISILTLMTLFLSPIFYPSTSIPERYQSLMQLNPLNPIIEQFRLVIYWQENPDFQVLAVYFFGAFLVAWFGYSWFQMTRRGFADVI